VQAVVRIHGFLQGLEKEAGCVVMTWKERSTSGRTFTRCKIVDEPADLPEGPYTLSFAGYKVTTRKFDGCWMLSFLPPGIDLLQVA
jgi:hypothetical protein